MKTLKQWLFATAAALGALGALAIDYGEVPDDDGSPSLTVNSVRQNYPWTNEVLINYTLTGTAFADEAAMQFSVQYGDGPAQLIPTRALKGDNTSGGALKSGTYTTVWTADPGVSCADAKMTVRIGTTYDNATHMVVDLATGAVTYLTFDTIDEASVYFNTDDYKLTKMAFVKIPKGSPVYLGHDGNTSTGTLESYTVPKDYFIGLFEVTVGQYTLMKDASATVDNTEDNKVPQASVSWNTLRGNNSDRTTEPNEADGSIYALNKRVRDTMSYSASTFTLDLPTGNMFEAAYRGTNSTTAVTAYFWGDDADAGADFCWSSGNAGGAAHMVGTKRPNAWGIYDIAGNVWEWSLDDRSTSLQNNTADLFLVGYLASGNDRSFRGGGFNLDFEYASASCRGNRSALYAIGLVGFRLARIGQ